MISLSTGARSAMLLGAGGLYGALRSGCILVYGGTRPTNADAAHSETPLGAVTTDGVAWYPAPAHEPGGLLCQMLYLGSLEKFGTWVFTASRAGTGTWWRWVGPAGGAEPYSQVAPRIDGDLGVDLVLSSYSWAEGATQTVGRFVVSFLES